MINKVIKRNRENTPHMKRTLTIELNQLNTCLLFNKFFTLQPFEQAFSWFIQLFFIRVYIKLLTQGGSSALYLIVFDCYKLNWSQVP